MKNLKKLSRTHSKKKILEMYSANMQSLVDREKKVEEALEIVKSARQAVWNSGATIRILYAELKKANPDYILPPNVAEFMKILSEVYDNVNQADAGLRNSEH